MQLEAVMNRLSLTFTALLLLVAGRLSGQTLDDDVNAMAVAVAAVQAKAPTIPSVLAYSDRSAALAQKLAAKLATNIVQESSLVTCQDDAQLHRKKCTLNSGVVRLINIGTVTVTGDRALVYLFVELPSNSPWQPIETETYVLNLARVNGIWTVVSNDLSVV